MVALSTRSLAVFAGSIVSLSLGNVLLKLGMTRLDQLAPVGLAGTVRAVLATPQIPLGVLFLAAQFGGMLALFRWGWEVSVVIPVFGLNYVVTALLGRWWLGEPVGWLRWLGVAAVTIGVALIAAGPGRPAADGAPVTETAGRP